jgi:hypothetical protein
MSRETERKAIYFERLASQPDPLHPQQICSHMNASLELRGAVPLLGHVEGRLLHI